jgi:hypothetical protein
VLKKNRFNPQTQTLLFTKPEEDSYRRQIAIWQNRLPGDVIFIVLGVVPLVIAAFLTYWSMRQSVVKAV